MKDKFIYVFDNDTKLKLLAAGFVLLKSDDKGGIYIFAANDNSSLRFEELGGLPSNTLTFCCQGTPDMQSGRFV